MAEGFTRDEIEKVAALAHLELTPTEIDVFGRQLGDILEYARTVQQVDTTGIPPTASALTEGASGSDRDDVVRPSLDRRTAIAAAPDGALEAGLVRVPRVLG